jgi:hypothetical protein
MPRPLYPGEGASGTHWIGGCAPEPVWTIWRSDNFCPYQDLNSEPLVVQPTASRYTDCTIPALRIAAVDILIMCVSVYLSY